MIHLTSPRPNNCNRLNSQSGHALFQQTASLIKVGKRQHNMQEHQMVNLEKDWGAKLPNEQDKQLAPSTVGVKWSKQKSSQNSFEMKQTEESSEGSSSLLGK